MLYVYIISSAANNIFLCVFVDDNKLFITGLGVASVSTTIAKLDSFSVSDTID